MTGPPLEKKVWIALCLATALLGSGCTSASETFPACIRPDDAVFVLEAQSVPSATRLPCIADLPIGWDFAGSEIRDDLTRLWLDHDRAGPHAVEVTLTATCDLSAAVEIPPASDEAGMRIYQEPRRLQPDFDGSRYQVFEGGCIEYRYAFPAPADPALVIEADLALSSLERAIVVRSVRESVDLTLCGAQAPPCLG
jgi:hypothetical protein